MNAVLERETGQATLDGVAPDVQTPAPDGRAFVFMAWGHALAPAHVHVTKHDVVQLVVLVEQHVDHHPQAVPLLAVWPWPDAGSYAATHERATARAALITTGTDVVVLGHGVEPGHHQNKPVLRVLQCKGIDLASECLAGHTRGNACSPTPASSAA